MCGGDAAAIFRWLIGDELCGSVEESTLLDWEDRHRVILYPFIRASDKKLFSDQFLNSCRIRYLQNSERILQVEHFFQKFNQFLTTHSIHAFVLKGVPLAENYYPDKCLRHSRDIDVLVQHHQINCIAEWLKLEGFHLSNENMFYNKKQEEAFFKNNHHFCFHKTKTDYPLIVELHWKLRSNDDSCNFNPFENVYPFLKTSYDHLQTLNHVDQFIYLCVHGTEHGWYRLKWLLDLPFLCQMVNLTWDDIRDRVHELNALEHVKLSLLLIHHITGKVLIPGFEMDSIENDVKFKVSKLLRRINHAALIETGYMTAVRQIWFLSSFNRRKCSWKFWLKWWISPADWKRFPLPDGLFFLYYPMRPIFWLIRKSFR